MPSSGTSTPIDTLEQSDRSPSAQNPTAEKVATASDSNVGPSKGRKPAWNVPSGTASPEPIMGAATWPALATATTITTTNSRSSPKSTSTASSSSNDDLKSLSDVSAAFPSVARIHISSPEKVVVPASQQHRASPTPNLTGRGSNGSENTHSHRSPRLGQHYNNRRGNNNNNNNHHYNNNNNNNNTRGGSRGRDRGSPIGNPSPGPQHFNWGNQVMPSAHPPPRLHYGFDPHIVHPHFYAPMGYGLHYGPYPMPGHVPISAPQVVAPMAPPDFFPAGELDKKSSILKQVEYYFSEDNLCHDDFLRGHMNNQGWVSISLIATFKRMRLLTDDLQLILESLNDSTVVEVQGNMVRRREKWDKYLLPPRLEHTEISSAGH